MGAFEHAVSLGYRYLETDVHLSADGALVAFHDADLLRTCGIDRAIADLTTAELAEIRVAGTAAIPLLSELFDRFPQARFNIDCKADVAVDALADFVRGREALDRVCLGSFSRTRLRRLRSALGPRLLTCLSPLETASLRVFGRVAGSALRAAQVPARYHLVKPPADDADEGSGARPRRSRESLGVTVVTERFVRAAHRRGIPVHVWTIDDRDEMERLLDLGVDGIMTDHPEVLRAVLEQRGEWPDD